jgi:hypothetical protein
MRSRSEIRNSSPMTFVFVAVVSITHGCWYGNYSCRYRGLGEGGKGWVRNGEMSTDGGTDLEPSSSAKSERLSSACRKRRWYHFPRTRTGTGKGEMFHILATERTPYYYSTRRLDRMVRGSFPTCCLLVWCGRIIITMGNWQRRTGGRDCTCISAELDIITSA